MVDEELLGGVAPPAVGVGKVGCDFLGCLVEHVGFGAAEVVAVFDAVDASELWVGFEVLVNDVFFEVFGEVVFVLDNSVVEVDEVEGSIWSGEEVDGAESFVGGGEEFVFAHEVFAGEESILADEVDESNEVGGGFAEEGGIAEEFGELVSTVGDGAGGSGGGGEVSFGVEGAFAASVDADGEAGGVEFVAEGDVASVVAVEEEVGVAAKGIGEELVGFDAEPVFVVEESAVFVVGHAPLSAEGGCFFDPFAVDFAVAGVGFDVVDPVIESAVEGIGSVFDVGILGVVFVDDGHFSGFAVVVFDEVEFFVSTEEDAIFVEGDGSWLVESVEEGAGGFVEPVLVFVFVDGDASDGVGFTVAVDVEHVASHFDHPHASIAVETDS